MRTVAGGVSEDINSAGSSLLPLIVMCDITHSLTVMADLKTVVVNDSNEKFTGRYGMADMVLVHGGSCCVQGGAH